MATQAQLRQRILDNLYASPEAERPALQRLNGAVAATASDTAVTVDDGTGFEDGTLIEFEDGEVGLVWGVSGNVITVIREQEGTSNAAHADNQFIKINPLWKIHEIDDAITEVLNNLNAMGIYLLATGTDLTLVAGQDEYEIVDANVNPRHGVVSIFYQDATTLDMVGLPFWNINDPLGQVFSTGNFGVRLLSWGNNAAGSTLEVVYAKDIASVTDTDTEPLLAELVVLGATGRLLSGVEGGRLHDPGRLADRTVQPGTAIRTGGFYLGQYEREVRVYRAHLRSREQKLPGNEFRKGRYFQNRRSGTRYLHSWG